MMTDANQKYKAVTLPGTGHPALGQWSPSSKTYVPIALADSHMAAAERAKTRNELEGLMAGMGLAELLSGL